MKTTNHSVLRKLVLAAFFIFTSFAAFASSEKTTEEEVFEVTDVIMHHVKDSHNFHLFELNGESYSIPLPVILWTKNGLVAFMSSEFHHDALGKVIVERKGMGFVLYHEDIYYAETLTSDGDYIRLEGGHHVLNPQPIDFSITKLVFTMFLSIILMVLIFGLSARAYKKNGVPKGIARYTEPLVVFVRDEIAIPNIGEKKYRKYMPYLLTLFFFIWINNLMGIIPVFPFSANLSGNIAFTLVLAFITFIITSVVANKNYWRHIFWMPGIPVGMRLFLAPIEFMGIFIKPLSLMIRLFANMTAGHIVVLSLISLIFIAESLWVAPGALLFSVFITLIEILVVAIQAYIFAMLSALYIGTAIEEDEH